jgi:aquaporin Z
MGLAMGATAMAIIVSPPGRRSGAHLNPAVSIAFWLLGRMPGRDAVAYAIGQIVGGTLGTLLAAALLGRAFREAPVAWIVTVPAPDWPVAGAFIAELVASFGLMLMVIICMRRPGLTRLLPWLAAVFIATAIIVLGPISGMSLNPARTLASTLPSGVWREAWIYLVAPVAGMGAAALLLRTSSVGCPKLVHEPCDPCRFCGHPGDPARETPSSMSIQVNP